MRLILLILAIWIALFLVRAALSRRRTTRDAAAEALPTRTVQCARCGVHLAENAALQHTDGRHYCSIEHARDDG